jgi:hypothetical protein
MTERLYECELCDWENPDWRYGFADAGASWASHMARYHRPPTQTDEEPEDD